MGVQLDHLILAVNDRQASIDFYTSILGLTYDGETDPFTVIRVTDDRTSERNGVLTPPRIQHCVGSA